MPPVDDAPAIVKTPRKPCRGSRCRKPPPSVAIRARVSGITASSSGKGTFIKINKGENAGIKVGWRGTVISESGARIPGGGFSVSKVTQSESYGTVRATPDAVTSAKYVRLRPP